MNEVVDKATHAKLPQAGRIRVRISRYWFRHIGADLKLAWGRRRWAYFRMCFYRKMRCANFMDVSVGPLNITLPMRWLSGPARQLHPNIFNEGIGGA